MKPNRENRCPTSMQPLVFAEGSPIPPLACSECGRDLKPVKLGKQWRIPNHVPPGMGGPCIECMKGNHLKHIEGACSCHECSADKEAEVIASLRRLAGLEEL